jgi:sulfur carrier protein
MRVRINGEDAPLAEEVTVAALILQRALRPETVAVELNGAVLARGAWEATVLKQNDTLEILSFVGGG